MLHSTLRLSSDTLCAPLLLHRAQHPLLAPTPLLRNRRAHTQDPDEALERLSSVGLNTIPSWTRPFHVLSIVDVGFVRVRSLKKDVLC